MKKSNIIKSSIVAGLGLLVGLGGCTMDKNNDATISKALSRNLDNLSSVVCKMDKVDDNFLYSSGGEKVSAIATPPQRYKIEYLDSDNSLENTDETNKEDVQDNNSSGIIEFRLYSTNMPYRYISTTYNPRFTSGADHGMERLSLLGQDVAVANNMYEDVKDELLSKTDELSNMIDIVEESNWNPDNDTRLAIKNYIEDLRQTISRIDTSYGQLNSTVKKIGQDNSNTIAPSYEVLNSNYMKILNHLDLRITYLKNAIATLENIRNILYVNIPGADIDDTNIDNNMMVDSGIQNQTDTNNNNEDYSDIDTNVNQNNNDTTLNDTNEEDTNTSDENNQVGQNNENQNSNQNDIVSDNNTNITDNNIDNNDINIGNNDTNTGIDNQNNNLQNNENLDNFDQNNGNGNSFNHNIDTYYPDGNIVNIDTMDPNYNSTVDTYNNGYNNGMSNNNAYNDGYNNNYNNTSYNNGMNNNYNGSNYVDQNTIGNNSINTDYDNAQNYNDNVNTNIDTMDQFTNIDTMQNNYNNDNINTNDNIDNNTNNNFSTDSNNDSNINNSTNTTLEDSSDNSINNNDRDIDPEFSQDMLETN